MNVAFRSSPNKQACVFLCVSTALSLNLPVSPLTQQWVRSVPERGGLLLHQDLLWDGGRQHCSSSFPAGCGPGLSSQLGLLWFSSWFGAADPTGAQAQVQLQLRARPEQAQSAQPVSPQQLLADPLGASVSGGCSRVVFSLGGVLAADCDDYQLLAGSTSTLLSSSKTVKLNNICWAVNKSTYFNKLEMNHHNKILGNILVCFFVILEVSYHSYLHWEDEATTGRR